MNNKGKWILAGLLVVGLSPLCWGEVPGESIQFTFKPKAGEVKRFKVVSKNVGSIKMPDPMPEQKFSQIFEQDYQITCKKINSDGSAVFDVRMPLIDMMMDMGMFDMSVRAEAGKKAVVKSSLPQKSNPAMESQGQLFSAMTDLQFTTTVGADGRTVKVEGFAEGMRKIYDKVDGFPEAEKKLLKQMMGSFGDELSKKNAISETSHFFPPGGSVRIGDTWTHNLEMKFPFMKGNFNNKTVYTLLGIEEFRGRRCAKIGLREKVEFEPSTNNASGTTTAPAAKTIFDSMEWKISSNEGQGVAYFDYQTGDIVRLRKTNRMNMEITMKMPPTGGPTTQPAGKNAVFKVSQNLNNSVSMDMIEPATP